MDFLLKGKELVPYEVIQGQKDCRAREIFNAYTYGEKYCRETLRDFEDDYPDDIECIGILKGAIAFYERQARAEKERAAYVQNVGTVAMNPTPQPVKPVPQGNSDKKNIRLYSLAIGGIVILLGVIVLELMIIL